MGLLMLLGIFRPNRVDTSHKPVDDPSHHGTPLPMVFCPRCSSIEKAVRMHTYKNCVCCFIPLPSVDMDDPVFGCSKCNLIFERFPQMECNHCETLTTFVSDFCPVCGRKKEVSELDDE